MQQNTFEICDFETLRTMKIRNKFFHRILFEEKIRNDVYLCIFLYYDRFGERLLWDVAIDQAQETGID